MQGKFIVMLLTGSFERQIHFNASEIGRPRLFPEVSGPRSVFPAILASLFGAGLINIAYSDAGEVCAICQTITLSSVKGDFEYILH